MKLPCPKCGSGKHRVLQTRAHTPREIYRRRQCECGHRFSTHETIVEKQEQDDALVGKVIDTMRALGVAKKRYTKRRKTIVVPSWVPERYRDMYALMAMTDETRAAQHVRKLKETYE